MITLEQLESAVQDGESEIQEFKRSTGELKSGMQTLCAFLNLRGGSIMFGVEDSGQIVGQTVGESTLRDISLAISQIDPPCQPTIELVPVRPNLSVVVVTVSKGHTLPCRYNGKAYKRLGNTTSELTTHEYNQIVVEQVHSDQRWESEPARRFDLSDLDGSEITRTVEEAIRRGRMSDPGTREPMELLRGLHLLDDGELLRAAVVLFGKSETIEARMPNCLLRVARFRGTEKTEFVDNRQFYGNLFSLLGHSERFLRESLPVASRMKPNSLERIDDTLYPFAALREALANAFCHRDYSIAGGSVSIAIFDDRLEISSSGDLHFGLTPEMLYEKHDSLPWNPLIARVLQRRGLVESWGRGTLEIVELTVQSGLPRPEITESGGCVTVAFTPSRYVPPQRVAQNITDRQQRVLSVISLAGSGLSLGDIADRLNLRSTSYLVKEDLAVLRTLGLVENHGHGRGAFWRLR